MESWLLCEVFWSVHVEMMRWQPNVAFGMWTKPADMKTNTALIPGCRHYANNWNFNTVVHADIVLPFLRHGDLGKYLYYTKFYNNCVFIQCSEVNNTIVYHNYLPNMIWHEMCTESWWCGHFSLANVPVTKETKTNKRQCPLSRSEYKIRLGIPDEYIECYTEKAMMNMRYRAHSSLSARQ